MTIETDAGDDAGSETAARALEAAADAKLERSRRKKAASRLGWKLHGPDTAEIKVEREFELGPRVIVLRGRVAVPLPEELTAEAGERAVAPLVDPAVAKLRHVLTRAAEKILNSPDDVAARHLYENPTFFRALEQAQRGIVREYQELENRRVDEHVERDLGLRFYLESFAQRERRFTYFAGPTNSGKTHAAVEALRAAGSGVYLAPLRLLALEIYERLNEQRTPASLVTGEERQIRPDARHTSSTVEMLDLRAEVDVAVIDEAQMLQDEQRGWAWTLALAGARAAHVILCGSPDGVPAAERLIKRLGGTLEVRTFERKNPLKVIEPVTLQALQPGDAVIAFSRSAVVDLQRQIARGGRPTAAIYGSLSPAVRRQEAERFRSGAADILVATDAIGLGLNLPIRRIVFAEVEKFDGVSSRLLTPPEIRQIAGRAGRFGLHEQGFVTALNARAVRLIGASLEKPVDLEPGPIWISPTDQHLRALSEIIGTTRISRLLQFFQARVLREEQSDLRIADISESIEVAAALELSDQFLKLPLPVRATYSRAPITTRGQNLAVFASWGDRHAALGTVDGGELLVRTGRDNLLAHEDRSRLATVYLWLSQRYPDVYTGAGEVREMREQLDDEIQEALLRQGVRTRQKTEHNGPPRRNGGPPKFDKRRLKRR